MQTHVQNTEVGTWDFESEVNWERGLEVNLPAKFAHLNKISLFKVKPERISLVRGNFCAPLKIISF